MQDGGDAIAVVGEFGDLRSEAVVGGGDGAVDEDPGELTSQDLQFGSGAVDFARTVHWERGGRRAVAAGEAHSYFTGSGRADVLVDAHVTNDLAGSSAYVDVLSFCAAPRESLDDGGSPAAGGELMSQGGSGDSGPGDDGVASHEGRCPVCECGALAEKAKIARLT